MRGGLRRLAAEKAEWELRLAEIQKQAEEARRLKKQKREESMITQRANVRHQARTAVLRPSCFPCC